MFKTNRFKMIAGATAVLLLLGVGMFVASRFMENDRKTRDAAKILSPVGIVLAVAGAAGGGFALWKYKGQWETAVETANKSLLEEGVTLALAPRSATLPESDVVGLWRRLSTWLKRLSDMPEPHITMEVVGNRDRMVILLRVPEALRRGITGEINREFPETDIVAFPSSSDDVPKGTINIFTDPPYEALEAGMSIKWQSFKMAANKAYPLYESGSKEDQLAALLGAVNNAHPQAYVGFQFVICQAPPNTKKGWTSAVKSLYPKPKQGQPKPQLAEESKSLIKAIEIRLKEPMYEVDIRAWAAAVDGNIVDQELQRMTDSMLAETMGRFNRLVPEKKGDDAETVTERRADGDFGSLLTASELGSFLHLPSKKVATPYPKLLSASAKKMPPTPAVVVREGEEKEKRLYGHYHHPTGDTDAIGQPFPNTQTHMFFIGPTGSGKSVALANNVRSDFIDGEAGCLVIEPSGDVPAEILAGIPPEYHNDIVILNPRDTQPFALNMCAIGTELGLSASVNVVIEAMKTAMGSGWDNAVRMQQLIVNGLYVVMDVLNRPSEGGASMLALAQFLQDPAYREMILPKASLVAAGAADFWINDFDKWNEKDQDAAVSTVMRRVGKWLGNPQIRRTLGMPMSTIDLARLLGPPLGQESEYRPKLVMLPLHVRMGQEAKSLLGGLFVNYYTSTMLLRDEIPRNKRRRAALHVDEFKNFVGDAGDGVETLLAECRKYAASVNLYTQGAAQISGKVMTEIKINCLTKGYFKLSAPEEARLASSQMAGTVDAYDLQRLPPYHAYMQLAVPGGQAPPVMVKMLPPKEYDGEQPKPNKGFLSSPPAEWRNLVASNAPFQPFLGKKAVEPTTPQSPQSLTAPELLDWVYHEAKSEGTDRLVQQLAELPDDAWNALRTSRAEYDRWRVAELKANPGLIQDPMARVVKRSRWEYGIPAWESDALYLRMKIQRQGAVASSTESAAASAESYDDW